MLPTVGLERAYLIADYCPSELEPRASQLCTRVDACVCTGAATGAAVFCSTHHVRAILQDGHCHSTGCLELLFPIKRIEQEIKCIEREKLFGLADLPARGSAGARLSGWECRGAPG